MVTNYNIGILSSYVTISRFLITEIKILPRNLKLSGFLLRLNQFLLVVNNSIFRGEYIDMFIPWFIQTIIDDVDLEKISLTIKLYRIAGEHELQS